MNLAYLITADTVRSIFRFFIEWWVERIGYMWLGVGMVYGVDGAESRYGIWGR